MDKPVVHRQKQSRFRVVDPEKGLKLDIPSVVGRFNVHCRTVYSWIETRGFPAQKDENGRWYVWEQDLHDWMDLHSDKSNAGVHNARDGPGHEGDCPGGPCSACDKNNRKYLTLAEVAIKLDVSLSTARHLIQSGTLPAEKRCKSQFCWRKGYAVLEDDVQSFLKKRQLLTHDWLSVPQVAQRLNCSYLKVIDLIHSGKLKGTKASSAQDVGYGKRHRKGWRVREADLLAFVHCADQQLVPLQEAAEAVGLSAEVLDNWIRGGVLEGQQQAQGHWLVRLEDVRAVAASDSMLASDETNNPQLLSLREACSELQVSQYFLRKQLECGRLPGLKVRRPTGAFSWRIRHADVEAIRRRLDASALSPLDLSWDQPLLGLKRAAQLLNVMPQTLRYEILTGIFPGLKASPDLVSRLPIPTSDLVPESDGSTWLVRRSDVDAKGRVAPSFAGEDGASAGKGRVLMVQPVCSMIPGPEGAVVPTSESETCASDLMFVSAAAREIGIAKETLYWGIARGELHACKVRWKELHPSQFQLDPTTGRPLPLFPSLTPGPILYATPSDLEALRAPLQTLSPSHTTPPTRPCSSQPTDPSIPENPTSSHTVTTTTPSSSSSPSPATAGRHSDSDPDPAAAGSEGVCHMLSRRDVDAFLRERSRLDLALSPHQAASMALLPVSEAAKALGIMTTTLRARIRNGAFPGVKVMDVSTSAGWKWMVRREDVEVATKPAPTTCLSCGS